MKEALESVRLKQRNAVAAVVGVTGAGKTCALHCVFGLQPPKRYTSTGVAERSFRGLLHRIANMGSFQLLSQREVFSFIAEAFASEESHISVDSIAKFQTESQQPGSRQASPSSSTPASLSTLAASSSSASPLLSKSSPGPSSPEITSCDEQLPVEESFAKSAMIDFVQVTTRSKREFVVELLHMIDTGGQPEFMEVMPCLIHNSDLTILVLNLEQPLDAYPKVAFHRDGKGFKRFLPSALTHRQIIKQLARTMQAKICIKVGGHGSKLIVIGTHYDCIWPWKRSAMLAAVNMELKSIFVPAFKNELIPYRSLDEIIYPVDARTPKHQVFEQIRQDIKKADIGVEIQMPPAYFMFEQDAILRANTLGRQVLSLDECFSIGAPLKMSPDVVEEALEYLHQNNIFLYFPTILPKLVFIDPQVPLDFVNKVVAFGYKVKCRDFPGLPVEYEILLQNGTISEEMLQHESLSSCFVPGLYESHHAIKLFTHLCVLAPLSESDPALHDREVKHSNKPALEPNVSSTRKFLMPCMLQDLKDISKFLPKSLVATFVVRFSNDCAPNGVFGGSLSTLLSSHGWEICSKKDGSPQCLAHNTVTLHDPKMPAQITYVNATRHYEVYVKADDMVAYASVCPMIRNAIFSAIQTTFEVMHFDETIEDAFLCCCKENASLSHAALPCTFHQRIYLKCSISGEPLGPADDKHKVWLSAEPTTPAQPKAQPQKPKERLPATEDRPTLPQLTYFKTRSGSINITEQIGTSYRSLGPHLLEDANGAVTQSIRDQYHHDAATINYEILQRWIQGKGMQPVQWSTLIDVLKKIELSVLAKKIEDNLQ